MDARDSRHELIYHPMNSLVPVIRGLQAVMDDVELPGFVRGEFIAASG
jgi:hypothetical protein